jgi:chemotaxis protein MotB
MNLLLILFIILYCSSKLDAERATQMAQSLTAGFSTMEGTASSGYSAMIGALTGTKEQPGSNAYWQPDEYGTFYTEVVALIEQNNLQDRVEAKVDDTGVIISFKDSALFETGSAELSTAAIGMIDEISGMLTHLDYSFILVEGHTDSDPILGRSQFVDNMDLSSARAGNVWRELVKCGLPPEGMASLGYGEYRPIAENDSPENKAKNRRVVISILKKPFAASSDLVADAPHEGASGETR